MNWDLYVVTDEGLSRGKTHAEIAEEAVRGGAGVIQLREKSKESRGIFEDACKMAEICKGKAVFIVNDRLDIALASGADGVHLGQSDIPLTEARRVVGNSFIIGISVGSLAEADEAVENGADYIAVSPVFDTGSKMDAGKGHGLALVREIRAKHPDIPLIGIGGLNKSNVADAVHAGLDGIAVISAVVSQEDIAASSSELLSLIKEAKK